MGWTITSCNFVRVQSLNPNLPTQVHLLFIYWLAAPFLLRDRRVLYIGTTSHFPEIKPGYLKVVLFLEKEKLRKKKKNTSDWNYRRGICRWLECKLPPPNWKVARGHQRDWVAAKEAINVAGGFRVLMWNNMSLSTIATQLSVKSKMAGITVAAVDQIYQLAQKCLTPWLG